MGNSTQGQRDLSEHRRQQSQLVHVTNFGYAYCIEHGADQPGMLAEKRSGPHRVVETVTAGDAAGYCDWPGCNMKFSGHPSTVLAHPDCPKHRSRLKEPI